MAGTLTIAVDGPAASGKGTIARKLAEAFDLPHLDTGLLYRAVATMVTDRDINPEDSAAVATVADDLTMEVLSRDDLRDHHIGNLASVVAAHQQVRVSLLEWQRNFAQDGAVLDGRDIGSVVLPDATAKLFITAAVDVRAARRWRELSATRDIAYRTVKDSIENRDRRDSGRSAAPMTQTPDADFLDTTEMTIDQAFAKAHQLVKDRIGVSGD